jgi:16S rRNA (cytidine1402-2'-O)-methyltransferase
VPANIELSREVPPGALFLIPTLLGPSEPAAVLPQGVLERVRALRYFLAEDPKSARAFLKAIGHPGPLASLRIERLLDHEKDPASLLAPVRDGMDAALVSEAGCPAVADPGADLVRLAHAAGVRVVPLVGPSSLMLALMASGLEGQRFAFHGYLPVKDAERAQAIRALEQRSRAARETQIFIETPYRNDAMMRALLSVCRPDTWLCVATDLTLQSEAVMTRRIGAWRRSIPQLTRRPSVFLLLASLISEG